MKIGRYIFSMPKTIFINFKLFPINIAIKLPILIGYDVKIKEIYKGSIIIKQPISRFMIKINMNEGSEGVNCYSLKHGYLKISKKAKIIFKGTANFSFGTSMRIEDGLLTFGSNFNANKNCFFACNKKITIGDNVLLGWKVNIRDCDGHKIFKNNEIMNFDKEVMIGNNVWIAANVDILKGSEIPNNCVIGYNSCISKKFKEDSCIIGGYPAMILQNNITWIM